MSGRPDMICGPRWSVVDIVVTFSHFDWNCPTNDHLKKGDMFLLFQCHEILKILKVVLTSSMNMHEHTLTTPSFLDFCGFPSSAGMGFKNRSSLKGWGSGPTPNSANTPVLGMPSDIWFVLIFFLRMLMRLLFDVVFWKSYSKTPRCPKCLMCLFRGCWDLLFLLKNLPASWNLELPLFQEKIHLQ